MSFNTYSNIKNKNFLSLSNVYLEDVFKWAWETMVRRDNKDGASLIVCENYKDGAKCFKQWAGARLNNWNTQKYDNAITLYSGAESIIFSKEIIGLPKDDYTFYIENACYFGFEPPDPLRVLLPVFKK